MGLDNAESNGSEPGKASQLVLTLNHETQEFNITGGVANLNVALAMLDTARRELQWSWERNRALQDTKLLRPGVPSLFGGRH